MKKLMALVALLTPLPALAQDLESDTREIAGELSDPVRQAQIATMAEVMADAVLDLPVGPFLRAAETMAGRDPEYVDPDLRVGDIAGPDAVRAPREFADRLPEMMGAMAGMAVAMEAVLPQLREAIDRARPAYEN